MLCLVYKEVHIRSLQLLLSRSRVSTFGDTNLCTHLYRRGQAIHAHSHSHSHSHSRSRSHSLSYVILCARFVP